MSVSLPLDFPPLVELATEAAQDHTVMFALSCKSDAALWCNIGEESRRARIGAFARLLSNMNRRESQAVWLGWLARRLGVPMPEAGSPQWRRVIDMHTSERVIGYALGPDPYAVDPHSGVAGRAGWLGEGPRLARFTNRPGRVGLETLCPALDNPSSADASIRALALFVETVGRMAP